MSNVVPKIETALQTVDIRCDGLHSNFLSYVRSSEFKRFLNYFYGKQLEDGFKSVVVMSLLPGEGKTFCVAALALGYAALLHKRVLVLETIKQPSELEFSIARVFGAPPLADKSERETAEKAEDDRVIDLISTFNIAEEFVESVDFHTTKIFRDYEKKYDLVLYDTCAMEASNNNNLDPVVLAKNIDTSLLVTSQRSLESKTAAKLSSLMSRWNLSPLGMLYNDGAEEHGNEK
jgi:Mrp family chromosome partitioning ATPase